MRCRSVIVLFLLVIAGAAFGCLLPHRALAQSPVEEKPTLKKFGSSLERLKWDPDRQAAVETKSQEKREGADTDDVVRVETQLVVCDVLILDKRGQAVTGLKQTDFLVVEDGVTQQISHFSLGDDTKVGRSIVLIIDFSGSLYNYLDLSVEAAKMLVDKLAPNDRMTIVTDDLELLIDSSSDKTQLKEVLETRKAWTRAHPGVGRSAQFSALLATVKELVHVEDIRPIIIFQTDGDELSFLQPPDHKVVEPPITPPPNGQNREYFEWLFRKKVTQFSLNDVYAATERSRATVYTIIPGIRLMGFSPTDQMTVARSRENEVRHINKRFWSVTEPLSNEALATMVDFRAREQSAAAGVATLTGGWTAFLEEPKQATDIYARILSDVNSRYVVGYYPSNKAHDGKRRKVRIEVRNHPEYTVEGRRSYFAPGAVEDK